MLTDVEGVKITAGPGANLLDATAFSGTGLFSEPVAGHFKGGSGADLFGRQLRGGHLEGAGKTGCWGQPPMA
ncbi:MAG: hypothetical protein CM1200mP2_41150 [Planctomycetaceae bacterium]|nr:MAG: hypothetical protein CM1200mP2_41150 [Planctomycetaceae bacterium]